MQNLQGIGIFFHGFQSRPLNPKDFCMEAAGTPRQSVGFPGAIGPVQLDSLCVPLKSNFSHTACVGESKGQKWRGLLPNIHEVRTFLSAICDWGYIWSHIQCEYTPGQKFIEFFFNELLHQDNWGNPQFVYAGMETYHISTNLWNVIGAGAMASVQCP